MARVTSLPEGASDLYGLLPAEFVARRNALVKELKRAKRADDAGVIAALRRPSVADHAINAAARADPELAQRWSVAVIAVAEAQQVAISGGAPGGLREATAMLRAETAALAEGAIAAIGDGAKRNEILGALRAATTRPGAALVAAGILGAADPEDELFAGATEPLGAPTRATGTSHLPAADRTVEPATDAVATPPSDTTTAQATDRTKASRTGRIKAAAPDVAGAAEPERAAAQREPVQNAAVRREVARAEAEERRAAALARAAVRVAAAEGAVSTAHNDVETARDAVESARDALREAEAVLLTAQRGLKRALAESNAATTAAARAARV